MAKWSAQLCSAATVSLEMNNSPISHCHGRITVEQVESFSFLLHLSEEFSFVKGNRLFPQDCSPEVDSFQLVLST